ncbi:MAG: AsmA family protein [Sphingomonadales bacterium]|nr:AsmA family protein [Sphingomonadales bacterium]
MEAFIYDAVRTPRGRGKPDGALHEVPPVQLAVQVLQAIRDRNHLDTADVDDVILGCVAPVGEQGTDIARMAVLTAGFAETVPGVQINRFCASGLEATNMALAKVISGEAELAIGGGVESMSRVPMGADGGAWASDPRVAYATYFAPQGIGADLIATKFGISRDDVAADIKAQFQLVDVDLQSCANELFGTGKLSGRGNLTVVLGATGSSPFGLAQTLAGTATLIGHDGAISGFNVEQLLKRLERRPLSGGGHFRSGQTPFETLSARRQQGDGREIRPQAPRANEGDGLDRLRADDHADRAGEHRGQAAAQGRHDQERH